jgi:hypothetical protein
MTKDSDLFAGVKFLEPTEAESVAAIDKTRQLLLAAGPKQLRARSEEVPNLRWSRFALAACLLVGLGAALWMHTSGNLAMADVILQLARSRTLRCIAEVQAPGNEAEWLRVEEFTYDDQQGSLLQQFNPSTQAVIRTEFDNGQYHWVQVAASDVVTQEPTASVQDMLYRFFHTDSPELRLDRGKRQFIDGQECRCLVGESLDQSSRVFYWIDADNRLRQADYENRLEDESVIYSRQRVEYDMEPKLGTFDANFGPSARIVDVLQFVDESLPVETALARETISGYEIAVHDLKRLSDFEYTMLLSFRPTEKTLAALDLSAGESPGELLPSMKRTTDSLIPHSTKFETVYPLAFAQVGGVRIWGLHGVIKGTNVDPLVEAHPAFTLQPHARLWSKVRPGSEIRIKVALPAAVASPEEFLRELYARMSQLETVPRRFASREVFLVDELNEQEFSSREEFGHIGVDGPPRTSWVRPSEMDVEAYVRHASESMTLRQGGVSMIQQE